ncbi:MAG: hypothetical protein ABIC36_01520 [bacterium]
MDKETKQEFNNKKQETRNQLVSRKEFEDLMGRVKYLETKLGVESGK